MLTDLESGSGTFVNGKKIEEAKLKDGDVVQIGDTRMRLEVRDSADQTQETLIPARPVLSTAEKLPGLVGHKLSYFEVQSVLAKGQSGLVFRAHDFRKDRSVALKVLWPEFSQNEEDVQRFVRAMKTMMPHRHPNLVALHGAGKTGPYCWISMELVEGESLTQMLERLGVAKMLDWRRVYPIAVGLASALNYAHQEGIIHRNLTPQNVMVREGSGDVKLGDLMLAKAQEGGLAQTITRPGEVLGDIRFMAPERAAGNSEIDARADLYSLGALMYLLLTGRPPFAGLNVMETIVKIRTEAPARPKKFQMSIPDGLEKMVLKLLAKTPDERFASASELLKALKQFATFHRI